MIKTDGIGCSVLFIKLDKNNNPCKIQRTNKKMRKLLEAENDCKYIEDITITQQMKMKSLVAVDPNHGNLNSCLMEFDNKNSTQRIKYSNNNEAPIKIRNRNYIYFRYTRSKRNHETKNKKYNMIREYLKKNNKIGDKTINEIESLLSQFDSRKCNFNDLSLFLKNKNIVNRKLYEHYKNPIYRK